MESWLSDHVNRPIPTSGTEVEVGGVLFTNYGKMLFQSQFKTSLIFNLYIQIHKTFCIMNRIK